MIFLSLMTASCSKDDVVESGDEVVQGRTITLNATINNGAETRLTYNDDPANNTMTVDWSTNEVFNLYRGTSSTASEFKKKDFNNAFVGVLPDGGEGNFYAVYGSDITNTDGVLSIVLSSQTGTSAENGIKEFMLAQPGGAIDGNTTLTFDHKLAVLKLTLTLPEEVDASTVESVTVSGMHYKGTYKLGATNPYTFVAEKEVDGNKVDETIGNIVATNGDKGFTIKDGKFTAYISVFPETVVKGQVTIIAKVGDIGYSYTMQTDYTFQEGTVTPAEFTLSNKMLCWTPGVTNADAVKSFLGEAGTDDKNLVICSSTDMTNDDFDELTSALKEYGNGTINLTLLNQNKIPDALCTDPEEDSYQGTLIYCNALKSFSAPNVTTVGSHAFALCSNLTDVFLPQVTSVGNYAFEECTNLATVSLPQVTSVGEYAFYDCSVLTTVSLPQVTSVGGRAFCRCTSLATVSLPQVTSVGNCAFEECTSLTTVELPQVTSVGRYAFYGCTSLAIVSLPQVICVEECAFMECTSLATVSLPQATDIDIDAFCDCTSLSSVSLPSATTVGYGAFNYCTRSNIELTVKQGSTWWKNMEDGDSEPNYGWKEVIVVKTNFKSVYTKEDYKTWSNENCKSAPSYDDMCKYLGAGVYWDYGADTYTLPDGKTYHTGLWVMKKAFIGTDVSPIEYANTSNGKMKKGRPSADEIYKYFFLPAAGGYCDGDFNDANFHGYYWLSSPVVYGCADILYFSNSEACVSCDETGCGHLPMVLE